jgi:glycogen(starch) synthase
VKILLYSPAFLPLIGGLEINTANLAQEMSKRGHEVVLVTTTAGQAMLSPYSVVRNPSPLSLIRWVRWCDVLLQQNVSLRGLWPLLFVRRPLVISHHSWYRQVDGTVALQDRMKRWVTRRAAASIPVSRALAAALPGKAVVIPNAYRDDLFRRLPDVPRTGDLLFVGRLVSDKGVDVLLEALAQLRSDAVGPGLTVVGDGPERERLQAQAARLGLAKVAFLGTRMGEELVRIMNAHRVLVVPSRYDEPFGIVALEGVACGCLVVASSGGGLPDALGPCGLTFRNGDAGDLTARLREALDRSTNRGIDASVVWGHLEQHHTARVTLRYLEVLAAAAAGHPARGTAARHLS